MPVIWMKLSYISVIVNRIPIQYKDTFFALGKCYLRRSFKNVVKVCAFLFKRSTAVLI